MRVNIRNGRCFRCDRNNTTGFCYKQLQRVMFVRPFCSYCLSKFPEKNFYTGWHLISYEEVLCLEVVES